MSVFHLYADYIHFYDINCKNKGIIYFPIGTVLYMYKYKPERNPRQALLLVACLSILTCTGFFVASVIDNYRLFAQLIAVMLLALAILIVIRYTITEYEYTVSHDSFIVSKTVGNKSTILCSINLQTTIALVDKKTYTHSKDFSDVTIKFNHNQNIKAAETYVFVYSFNGKKGMIEFEPNACFVKILSEAIENARKDRKDNNNPD